MWKFSLLVLASCSLAAEPVKFAETLHSDWGQFFDASQEIVREKTDCQDLLVFENSRFGRVLALDGIVQLTEADEPIYHEMMAHVPLLTHPNPTAILVIGGGDGGILREALKHSSVQRAVLVEIDSSVIAFSKKYFPKVSNGAFDDPRVEAIIQDAAEFVKSADESFDVIICDSSDPIGPSAVLFTEEFFGDCKSLLRDGGIFVNMSGVPFLQKHEQALTLRNSSPHYNCVKFYLAPVPTYAGGFLSMGWASDQDYQVPEEVLRERLEDFGDSLFYYTPAIHKASFALPKFMMRQLEEAN